MGMIKDTGGDSYSAGNIRHGEKWLGLATEQPDPAFCRFVSPEYGTRAMGRILSNYQRRHGLKTLRGIVSRWAPPAENDTDAYIRHVCDQVGAGPDDAIDMENPETLEALTAAIITHEKWDQSIQPRTDPPLHRLGPGGIGARYGTDFGGPEEMIF
jgi:hypothetical protein